VLRLLLEDKVNADAKGIKDGGTALHVAAGKGHEGAVRLLLKHNADNQCERMIMA
jgi:ankyrin repeat protein